MLTTKEFNNFLEIMNSLGEPLFGTKKEIKKQLETCIKFQGYWSGNYYRIYYNENNKEFSIEEKRY